MLRTFVIAFAALSAVPAQAALITESVNVQRIDNGDVDLCFPCAPGSITIDPAGSYSVSWFGSGGNAHDIVALTDPSNIWEPFGNAPNPDVWLLDHPDGIELYRSDAGGKWGVVSDWQAYVFDGGELVNLAEDFIDFQVARGGTWFTTSNGEGLEAQFTAADPPAHVPEPSSLILLLSAAGLFSLRNGRRV